MPSSQNHSDLYVASSDLNMQMTVRAKNQAASCSRKTWRGQWRSPAAIATLVVLMVSACSSTSSSSSAPTSGSESAPEAIANSSDADSESTDNADASDTSSTEASDAESAGGQPVGAEENIGVALAKEEFDQLLPFSQEAERLNVLLRCAEGKLYPPAFDGDGSLYKCVAGDGESLRIFLREDPETEAVKNLKILWFGDQVPEPDSQTGQVIQTLADYYGGDRADELEQTFWDDDNEALETDILDIEYRYRAETNGSERLMVISPKS